MGLVLVLFNRHGYRPPMGDEPLKSASAQDIAGALAFALRFDGRTRKHGTAEMMARIVADRLVKHLERSGFVVVKWKFRQFGAAALARGLGEWGLMSG